MRLDLYLVQSKKASSRSQAQELIHGGLVYYLKENQKVVLKKPNYQISENHPEIFIEEGPANRFVSRGGLKLEGALQYCGLSVAGWKVLDVGISTGGFTDCLLQKGVDQVLGVDVGHDQLHPSLRNHPRVQLLEGVNARDLDQNAEVLASLPSGGFDLIVMDVSFISIGLIIPKLPALLRPGGFLLSLVKPQFEVGPEGLSKGGLVKDPGLYSKVEIKVRSLCQTAGLSVKDYFSSPIEGKDGNKEFFIFAQKE